MQPTKAECITIIKDLVQKYPKGPTGKLTKADYTTRYTYDTCTGNYRNLTGLSEDIDATNPSTLFGYSLHMLMEIAAHPEINTYSSALADDEWDWKRIVRDIYPEISRKAVTSRARRLARRIAVPASRLWRSGEVAGVYKVAFDTGTAGCVYAYGQNKRDAEIVAKTMCGFAYENAEPRWTNLQSLRDVSTITQLNARSADAIQEAIEEKLKRIAQIKEQIEGLESKMGVISTFSTLQVAAMVDAISS